MWLLNLYWSLLLNMVRLYVYNMLNYLWLNRFLYFHLFSRRVIDNWLNRYLLYHLLILYCFRLLINLLLNRLLCLDGLFNDHFFLFRRNDRPDWLSKLSTLWIDFIDIKNSCLLLWLKLLHKSILPACHQSFKLLKHIMPVL